MESYAHLHAKQTLAGWLRSMAAHRYDKAVNFGDLYWRVNRQTEPYGVWIEYPMATQPRSGVLIGTTSAWDEEGTEWLVHPPTYDQLVAQRYHVHAIVDVALQCKGSIAAAIEIYHKHPISSEKLQFLRKHNIEIWQVPAHWVLGQVAPPSGLPAEFRVE